MTALALATLGLLVLAEGAALVVFIRRLFQYDAFVDLMKEGLEDYAGFVKQRVKRGILEAHPEIMEFHERTMDLIRHIETWGAVISKGLDPRKPSTAELMESDPGKGG